MKAQGGKARSAASTEMLHFIGLWILSYFNSLKSSLPILALVCYRSRSSTALPMGDSRTTLPVAQKLHWMEWLSWSNTLTQVNQLVSLSVGYSIGCLQMSSPTKRLVVWSLDFQQAISGLLDVTLCELDGIYYGWEPMAWLTAVFDSLASLHRVYVRSSFAPFLKITPPVISTSWSDSTKLRAPIYAPIARSVLIFHTCVYGERLLSGWAEEILVK